MRRTKQAMARKPKRLTPHVKIWLECGGHYGFGFGVSEILRAVERTGSIKQAADELGKSYRYVWQRIKDAEATIGQTLVETRVGGQGTHRSFLTESAKRLTTDFLAMRDRIMRVMQQEFARRFA